MNGYLIFLIIFLIYIVALYVLWKKKYLDKHHISLLGPFLMIRSTKGIGYIEKIASHKKIWHYFGTIAIGIVSFLMVVMVYLLVWEATLVSKIPPSKAPSPTEMIGIPGINPFIPVVYGIIALVIAVVVHEFFHGFTAKSYDLKIKSVGILYLILPMGAFVETDDEELKSVKRSVRSRVAAAGPGINLVMAVSALLIFMLLITTSVQPVTPTGLAVYGVIPHSAAANAGITGGDVLISINNYTINNYTILIKAVNSTKPGKNVSLEYWSHTLRNLVTATVVMSNRSIYSGNVSQRNISFLGVLSSTVPPNVFLNFIKNPFAGNFVFGFLAFITMPFFGLEPIPSYITNFYTINGVFSFMPSLYFWGIVNMFYWLFWLNLMLAFTNALPAIPLDGSYIYHDAVTYILEKINIKGGEEHMGKLADAILVYTTIIVFGLILWQLIGPRII